MLQIERMEELLNYGVSIDWERLSDRNDLPIEFICKYIDRLGLDTLSGIEFTEDQLDTLVKHVDINGIIKYVQVGESFLTKYENELNWSGVSRYQQLSIEELKLFKHRLDWEYVSLYMDIDDEMILTFWKELNLVSISKYQILSDDFIDENPQFITYNRIQLSKEKYDMAALRILLGVNISRITLDHTKEYHTYNDILKLNKDTSKLYINYIYTTLTEKRISY